MKIDNVVTVLRGILAEEWDFQTPVSNGRKIDLNSIKIQMHDLCRNLVDVNCCDEPLNQDEIELLKCNWNVEVVKSYRNRTGCSVLQAKTVCDRWKEENVLKNVNSFKGD